MSGADSATPGRSIATASSQALWRGVASLTLLRFAGDTAVRAPVPFVIFIAASYGALPESAGWFAVALGMSGLVSPLVSVIERRVGARRSILISTAIFAGGCFALAFAPSFPVALALCVVLGLGRSLIGPQAQAFVADTVPFARRGAVLGVLELAWALAWIAGVPAFGFLIQRAAWWVPFSLIGVISIIGTWATLRFAITRDHAHALAAATTPGGLSLVIRHPSARRVLLFGFGLMIAINLTVVVYAPHLVARFGLTAEQLGLISIVLGVADVVAEGLIIFALDRIGKQRSVMLGLAVMGAGLAGFLVGGENLVAAMASLFLVFLGFEYAVVSNLPVASEVLPMARTAMMGSLNGVNSLGRTLAALAAIPLYAAVGLRGVLAISLTALAMAALAFWSVKLDEKPRRIEINPGAASSP